MGRRRRGAARCGTYGLSGAGEKRRSLADGKDRRSLAATVYTCPLAHSDRGEAVRTLIVIIIVTGISSWIGAVRMRRRIRRAIGKDVQSEAEMTSLNMWMKVKDAEQRNQGKP